MSHPFFALKSYHPPIRVIYQISPHILDRKLVRRGAIW